MISPWSCAALPGRKGPPAAGHAVTDYGPAGKAKIRRMSQLVHDMEYLATEEGVELIGAATTIEKAYRGHDIRHHKAAWVAVDVAVSSSSPGGCASSSFARRSAARRRACSLEMASFAQT